MKTRSLVWPIGIGAALVASVGFAQPDRRGGGQPPATPPSSAAQRGELPGPGAKTVRERLESRREQLQRMQERLDRAMKLLDGGATEEQLREEFPEFFWRPGAGGGVGPGGQGGPGGGDGMEIFDGPPGQGGGAGVSPGGRRPGMRGEGPEGGPDGMDRPDRGGGDRWRERGGPDRAPTDEERAAIRAFLRDVQPRLYQMLEDLEKQDPAEAQRKVAEAFPRLRPLLEMRQADPEMFELRMKDLRNGREAMEAARWLAEHGESAGSADVSAHHEQLRASMLAQFDARTEIQRRDLARQVVHLEEARADLESRAADREKSVDSMMSRMIERERERLQRGDGPEEGPPPGGPDGRRRRGGDR